ncbi:MAG: [FeFe] hydrogenase H-cluster maturation GTPase HydF [Bacillota bacterium]|nr:[FeFe] hydrogenase H-cluster maturation GTPase HydF [Bacillota bacterium]
MNLNDTPRADRLHIGLFGRRNSGKSSLINRLTGQEIALVSDTPGTTADPVFKSMELHPVGPVVFIDTAGYDDEGELGLLRVGKTRDVIDVTDIGIIVVDGQEISDRDFDMEKEWIGRLKEKNIPIIMAVNKIDMGAPVCGGTFDEAEFKDIPQITVSAVTGEGIAELRTLISEAVPEDYMRRRILGELVTEESLVVLVMPQDIQAPKGRLILPQVQTIRELLDRKCTAVATSADVFARTLNNLKRDPDLIITDSQCFRQVYEIKPEKSLLTSFSVLFAAYKGDVGKFMEGAGYISELGKDSRVLIAEACTHVPLGEDIGRVKIPRMLRQKAGEGIEIVNVCGNDFPDVEELRSFDLIIHCGACMFNRAHVMSRIAAAEAAGTPITNYGIAIAEVTGILDKIEVTDK